MKSPYGNPYGNPWKGSRWVKTVVDGKAAARGRVMLAVAVASSGAIASVVIAMAVSAGHSG